MIDPMTVGGHGTWNRSRKALPTHIVGHLVDLLWGCHRRWDGSHGIGTSELADEDQLLCLGVRLCPKYQ